MRPITNIALSPARFIDIPAENYPSHHPAHYRGKKWNYLAFGLPLLVHKISSFCRKLIEREKANTCIKVRFNSTKDQSLLEEFKRFYAPANGLLKISQRVMLAKILNKTKLSFATTLSDADLQKINNLKALQEKDSAKRYSRHDLNETEWKLIDEIDYEILRSHCSKLHTIFNSESINTHVIQNTLKNTFNIDYHEALLAEIIAFSIAYVQHLDDKTIELPVYDPETKLYRQSTYTITHTTIGDNLPCYLLESSDPLADPWITIRGTQRFTALTSSGEEMRVGSAESILADVIDTESIADNLINKAIAKRRIVKIENENNSNLFIQKNSLEDIFYRIKKSNKKAIITGHSLGGTVANTLAIEYQNLIRNAYGFSSVGVSKNTFHSWQKLKEDSKNTFTPVIQNFASEGDPVPTGGSSLIGEHYAIKALGSKEKSGLYKSHVRRHLWRDFSIHSVDVERENGKIERKVAEKIRIFIGKVLGFMLKLSRKKKKPDWWINRRLYQEQANLIRKIRSEL